jgi:hypothetical protein
MQNLVKDTNQVALKAIQKELDLELLIKKEEQEREEREEKELQIVMDQEKKKSDYLNKAIKEKTIENQYNLKNKQYQEEIQNIKQTTAQQVMAKRNQLKEMLAKMRKNAELRKNKLKQQILSVRYEMANNMTKVTKKGEKDNCANAMKSQSDIKTYCTANFSEDFNLYTQCNNSPEDFCRTCCEFEFGDFYIEARQECYTQVCNSTATAATTSNSTTGRWIWQNAIGN